MQIPAVRLVGKIMVSVMDRMQEHFGDSKILCFWFLFSKITIIVYSKSKYGLQIYSVLSNCTLMPKLPLELWSLFFQTSYIQN